MAKKNITKKVVRKTTKPVMKAKKEEPSFAKQLIGESARGALSAPSFLGSTIKEGFNFLKTQPSKTTKK